MSPLDRDSAATAGSSIATLAVLASSACCVGPLGIVFAWVGLGSTTLLAIENVLGPLRPWVLGATVLALSYAFWATYRRDRACDASGSSPEEDEARHALAQRLHLVVLWGATALFALLLYFTYVHPNLDVFFGLYI